MCATYGKPKLPRDINGETRLCPALSLRRLRVAKYTVISITKELCLNKPCFELDARAIESNLVDSRICRGEPNLENIFLDTLIFTKYFSVCFALLLCVFF